MVLPGASLYELFAHKQTSAAAAAAAAAALPEEAAPAQAAAEQVCSVCRLGVWVGVRNSAGSVLHFACV